jgi:hypothetical protein
MYANQTVAYGATVYECLRHHMQADNLNDSINSWLETHVPDDRQQVPCTGDILCQRVSRRHKKNCIGRDLPFDKYADALARVVQ